MVAFVALFPPQAALRPSPALSKAYILFKCQSRENLSSRVISRVGDTPCGTAEKIEWDRAVSAEVIPMSIDKLHNIYGKFSMGGCSIRGCEVDIGIVYATEKNKSGQLAQIAREIDFIATRGGKKTYIQSAYALETGEKAATENKPLVYNTCNDAG